MKLNKLNRLQRFVLLMFVWLLILFITLLIVEGALRLRSYVKTGSWWGVEETFVVDDKTGLRIPRPGFSSGPITINADGFRNPPLQTPKPEGSIRIAFIGASTTYCAEVSSNQMTWPHMVTEAFRERNPGIEFEYINGGVPGYGVSHSLRNLRDRIAVLAPDIVVIYHATNDLSGNSFVTAVEAGLIEKRLEQEKIWLSKYSLLSHLIELNLKISQLQNESENETSKLQVDLATLAEPFQKDLTSLVQLGKRSAPIVAIATFSVQYRKDQTEQQKKDAASTSLYYMPYMSIDGLIASFDRYNHVIREVAQREKIILIGDENAIPGDVEHFNDSVHFTDKGSQAMSDRVVSVLLNSAEVKNLINAKKATQ